VAIKAIDAALFIGNITVSDLRHSYSDNIFLFTRDFWNCAMSFAME
jgi:hypothetical protein